MPPECLAIHCGLPLKSYSGRTEAGFGHGQAEDTARAEVAPAAASKRILLGARN